MQVSLIQFVGSDKSHAMAAWASTSQEVTPDKLARIPALLEMLAANNHHSPFEHSSFTFKIVGDIATHIHCLKHRIGVSINSQSARYREVKEDTWYVPSDWPLEQQQELNMFCQAAFKFYHDTLNTLVEKGMSRNRAKESARFFLPYATELEWVQTFNFRSLMHFQELRNSEHAQKEVRELAQEILTIVDNLGEFKWSLKAFGY